MVPQATLVLLSVLAGCCALVGGVVTSPSVTGLSVASVAPMGGAVTLTGSGLGSSGVDALVVRYGGYLCRVDSHAPTQVKVFTPPVMVDTAAGHAFELRYEDQPTPVVYAVPGLLPTTAAAPTLRKSQRQSTAFLWGQRANLSFVLDNLVTGALHCAIFVGQELAAPSPSNVPFSVQFCDGSQTLLGRVDVPITSLALYTPLYYPSTRSFNVYYSAYHLAPYNTIAFSRAQFALLGSVTIVFQVGVAPSASLDFAGELPLAWGPPPRPALLDASALGLSPVAGTLYVHRTQRAATLALPDPISFSTVGATASGHLMLSLPIPRTLGRPLGPHTCTGYATVDGAERPILVKAQSTGHLNITADAAGAPWPPGLGLVTLTDLSACHWVLNEAES